MLKYSGSFWFCIVLLFGIYLEGSSQETPQKRLAIGLTGSLLADNSDPLLESEEFSFDEYRLASSVIYKLSSAQYLGLSYAISWSKDYQFLDLSPPRELSRIDARRFGFSFFFRQNLTKATKLNWYISPIIGWWKYKGPFFRGDNSGDFRLVNVTNSTFFSLTIATGINYTINDRFRLYSNLASWMYQLNSYESDLLEKWRTKYIRLSSFLESINVGLEFYIF